MGQRATRELAVDAAAVRAYAELTGDYNPLHFDGAFARGTRFGRLIAQGGITTGLLHALVAMDLPGPGSVFVRQQWTFPAPVYIGDAIRAGFLSQDDLPADAISALGDRNSQRVNTLVNDVVATSWDATGETESTGRPWIRMSEELTEVVTHLRDFMFETFYLPISAGREGRAAAAIVELLFVDLVENIDQAPCWIRNLSDSDEQAAADYLCGMTDNFAITQAERLRPGISEGVFDGRV